MTARTPPRFATLVALTALTTLTLNMFLPSLPAMAADFAVDYATISWSVSGYLAVTAVLQLFIGPLSDRYGRRPVALAVLAIFAAASAVCAVTEDVTTFLIFRMLQGAVIGGWALAQAVVRDTAEPARAASMLGFISMFMAIAPMTGPMVGGVLEELFGWRATFIFYTGAGVALLALIWADMGETNTRRSETLSGQMRAYPGLLRAPAFWGYALCTAFSTSTFYTFLAGAPLVAAAEFAISPAVLGIGMGIITTGYMAGSFLAGRYSQRFGLSAMMIAGRLIGAAGMIAGLGAVALGALTPVLFFGAAVFVGLGNGITMPSSNAGAMSVKPDLAGSAAGLTGSLTVGLGAALTAVAGMLLTPDIAAVGLLWLMLATILAALAAALLAGRTASPALAGD
jgi:Bcr/CflA subfamily drug resistance transporter